MNILLIPSWYATVENPNAGSFFREQAKSLKKAGHNVSVLVVHMSNWPYCNINRWFKIQKYNDDGIWTIHTTVPTFGTSKYSKLFFLLFTMQYKRLFKYYIKSFNANIDIIHAHSFWPAGYAATQIKKIYKIPLVITEHRSIILTEEIPSSSMPYLESAIQNSDVFFAVSRTLADTIEKRLKIKNIIQIMPNAVASRFHYHEQILSTDVNFLSIGNLVDIKCFDVLIQSFSKAFLEESNVKLFIVGTGKNYSKLDELIKHLNMQNNIMLLGAKSRAEVADLLRKTNIFVLISHVETFGVAYIEALATGRPVIATKNGGANDLITQSNGILLDKDNEEDLIYAFRYMKNHFREYDSLKISEDCIAKYSEENLTKHLLNIYSQIQSKELIKGNANSI